MENQTKPLNLSQFEGHTPGPWRCVDRSEVSGVPSSLSTIPFAIECPVGSSVIPIADVCNFPEATPAQTAYQRANGRLLAAGPALLAECKRLQSAESDAKFWAAQCEVEQATVRRQREDLARLQALVRGAQQVENAHLERIAELSAALQRCAGFLKPDADDVDSEQASIYQQAQKALAKAVA